MYKILNEGQGQGLWETLVASMTYPQLLVQLASKKTGNEI
jgi:hypothetical protein